MHQSSLDKVRFAAERKGLRLIKVGLQPATRVPLYKLVVPEADLQVFPQGVGVAAEPLHVIEEWLSAPWE